MTRPPWEVADIIHRAGNKFFEQCADSLTWTQLSVLRAIQRRCPATAALGRHRDQCVRCGHQALSYNSCRNRHCPKCQTNAREKWLCARRRNRCRFAIFTWSSARAARARPVDLCKTRGYLFGLLFDSSAANAAGSCGRSRLASVPRSASSAFCTPGDRTLQRHPHVHCVVPGWGTVALITRAGSARPPTSFYR